jgi:hypothetical protein
LPSGVTFISATPSQGTGCDFNLVDTVHCVLGSIASGGSATVDIAVSIDINTIGAIVNDAHIHIHNDEDTDDGNDTFYCTTDVTEAIPTMTEWGMIIFMVLAGLGAVYFIRRQKTVKS